jgi:sporadic carbohydrate cluster 2OG-Fe(II) oxygenase
MKLKNYNLYSGDIKILNPIYRVINQEILKINKNYNLKLEDLHKFISYKKINLLRTKCFQKINALSWKTLIKNLAFDNLVSLMGPDLLVQSKINLSIQMPGDKASILPAHSDSWSSDTPFQLNLWIPITDAYDSNSMFVLSKDYSQKVFKKINKFNKFKIKKPKKEDFINLKVGQYIIFNPAYLHGNINNLTNNTRVSLNLRFKSLFSPEPNKFHQDRKFGTYYQTFSISKNTKFAMDIIKSGFLN